MSGSWAAALGELIPLALVVALSPLSIIPAIVLVLHTDRARATGLAFMSGWLLGLAAMTAVFVQVPHLVDGLNRRVPDLGGMGADRGRHRAPRVRRLEVGDPKPCHRAAGMAEPVEQDDARRCRDSRVRADAGQSQGARDERRSGFGDRDRGAGRGGGWFGRRVLHRHRRLDGIVPILAYAVAGERVDHQLERVKQWMQRQHAVLMAGFLVVVGLLLVYTGIRAV